MDLKTFKTDLTYFCKKAQKESKVLSSGGDFYIGPDGKFVLDGNQAHPLELFIIGKGYAPIPHMDAYSLSVSDIVSFHTQIPTKDLYSFMDGFENYEGLVEDWYKLGVYIREKFPTVGLSSTLVTPKVYQPTQVKDLQSKYYFVNTKRNFGVYQVAVSTLHIPWLLAGEQKYLIESPDFLKGEEMMFWALYDTPEACTVHARESIRNGFEASLRKRKVDDEDIAKYSILNVFAQISQLKVITL
jgi:hypothetical protein